jgi:hypothetical protein
MLRSLIEPYRTLGPRVAPPKVNLAKNGVEPPPIGKGESGKEKGDDKET